MGYKTGGLRSVLNYPTGLPVSNRGCRYLDACSSSPLLDCGGGNCPFIWLSILHIKVDSQYIFSEFFVNFVNILLNE